MIRAGAGTSWRLAYGIVAPYFETYLSRFNRGLEKDYMKWSHKLGKSKKELGIITPKCPNKKRAKYLKALLKGRI